MKESNPSRSADREAPMVWRSLDELAQSPDFEEKLHREFPRQAATWDGSLDRRRFLGLAGASLGLAGLTACSKQPSEKIVPYVRQPEEIVPGKPLFFATSMALAGYAQGLLAESHLGRPTKIEGNPEHPASLGGTDVLAQASVLDLYDPDRSQAVTHLGKIRTWSAFVDDMTLTLGALQGVAGKGLRILTGTTTSPTFGWLWQGVQEVMPEAKWHQLEPAGRDEVRRAARAAFGEPVEVRYDFTRADVVLAVDSDFLHQGPAAVRYARDFASRRQVADPAEAAQMSRLYSVESTPTGLSTVADHRLALGPTEVGHFVLALAAKLGIAGVSAPAGFDDPIRSAWVDEVAADLEAHRGASVVVPGEYTHADIQVLCHAINDHLGNLGSTVLTTDPVTLGPDDQGESFAQLVEDMMNGEVDTLLILGVNPVYSAAPGLRVARALKNVRMRVHLGSHLDETSSHCHWHIPEAHYLEAWGDARAFDGTASIAQPLVEPLYGGKSALEVLAVLTGELTTTADELLQSFWAGELGGGDGFERQWRRSLHDGLLAGTAFEPRAVALQGGVVTAAAQAVGEAKPAELELVFRPDPTLFDGRFANNGWLQECPKPITKLTWDNALLVSPATGRALGLGDPLSDNNQGKTANMAQVTVGEASLEVPVWMTPGQADGTATLHLGHGRTQCGQTGAGCGFDVGVLRTHGSPWTVAAQVAPTTGTYSLASTQDHHSMEGRHLVRMTDLEAYRADPEHAGAQHHHVDTSLSLMDAEEFPYDGYKWGMTLDLTSCTGCNACLMACNSENNVPVVGKDQVLKGREMHWIRIDRYFTGPMDAVADVVNQPVNCMQCEQAPCELVCPVAATTHSDEGLNDMVYNRCVGTRYCSNNCPYKVRRFNFLLYQDFETPSLQLGRNPDVTVRSRGVMEKCTYCVQRINSARITAKREKRRIRDGEVTTACQGACPSGAIVFGDINDPESQISKSKASPAGFTLLEELGTRPRTTYLGRIRNPNPSLSSKIGPAGGDTHDAHSGGH